MKKTKVPVKVVARAKLLAHPKATLKQQSKTVAQDKKAKVVAALKRLHPMD